ncbi:MAG: cell shape determination protein CcmA [Bacteroidetes bacterium HGW-Bacteroidetes-9]|nr:MAG: cell shape determination protein CcmA [Bacteroidetes bacterium HGW-Bacteroidetes-9]
MAKNNLPETPSSANLIQSGTFITGNIQSNGNIRIDGTLTGTVVAGGKVILGSTGSVEGDIKCINADIEGMVNGTIQVKELLSFKASAVVKGEIFTSKLAIEPGARFSGTCRMDNTPAVESQPTYAEEKSE